MSFGRLLNSCSKNSYTSRDLGRHLSSIRFLLGVRGKQALSQEGSPFRSISLGNYCELLTIDQEFAYHYNGEGNKKYCLVLRHD